MKMIWHQYVSRRARKFSESKWLVYIVTWLTDHRGTTKTTAGHKGNNDFQLLSSILFQKILVINFFAVLPSWDWENFCWASYQIMRKQCCLQIIFEPVPWTGKAKMIRLRTLFISHWHLVNGSAIFSKTMLCQASHFHFAPALCKRGFRNCEYWWSIFNTHLNLIYLLDAAIF